MNFGTNLSHFARLLFLIMYRAPGVGLAAPQVGVNKRMFVVNPSVSGWEGREEVFVNPVLVEEKGQKKPFTEGCLSFPDMVSEISRKETVVIRAFDVEGREFERRFGILIG